jgi:hypothetical protein
MATSITTDANLIDGIVPFVPIAPGVLEKLTPPHLRDVGRAAYHNSAWKRCVMDIEQRGIDEDYLGSDAQTQLKPAVCHLVMHFLYQANVAKAGDKNETQAKYHKSEYERIRSSVELELTTGTVKPLGECIRIRRAT